MQNKIYQYKDGKFYAIDILNFNLEINIRDTLNYVWKNLKLDFFQILNEIYECLFFLKKDNDRINKDNILENIVSQRELRNIIIDGLILGDLEYSKKFFNYNLYNIIENNFKKFNPRYKTNIYKFFNKKGYNIYPSQLINIILYSIKQYLKFWLKKMCQFYLCHKQNNIIYF